MTGNDSLITSLRREILFARRRIYEVGHATPLDEIELDDPALSILIKREDLSPIHAYKWRGAYNRMAQLSEEELACGVVTASAGNHAQGVALAAKKLGTQATIYMPLSTPRMKQLAVKQHGGARVEIILHGDTYDAASAAAYAHGEKHGLTYIHAYDDLAVMAGQGTLADEVVMSGKGPFDYAFLQVGGGGMAAATAVWLKMNFPNIRIIGVGGVGQASMAAAVAAGHPVDLAEMDLFCDGTAVRRAGELTYEICAEVVDEWMTVSNEEVSSAIQFMWEELRCIPEPSGAMGVAGILQRRQELAGKRVLAVLCGANMDFEKLALISRGAAAGDARRRVLRIEVSERAGSMLALLETLPAGMNIVDFQYGKTHAESAHPVIGFNASAEQFLQLEDALEVQNYPFSEVTAETDVDFRLIHYEADLLRAPFFITLEFHERAGALADFLRTVSEHASLCYFNYVYSGERVGHALLGFDFDSASGNEGFVRVLDAAADAYRSYKRVTPQVMARILA
ncbi:MAG: pyridoxal-phosphate dependent enzyme [Verrucomicrobiales bacterium]|nr:pyridoxal-phosphate dependent enzyme [Verrucomicrobiales bacterium]